MPTYPSIQNEDDVVMVNVDFSVAGVRLHADLPVPSGPTAMRALLPVLHAVTDAIVGVAEENSLNRGKPISCKKGCGACCRQLVPISLDEAEAIQDLVSQMSAERRETVLTRFDAAHQKMAAGGLLEKLRYPDQFTDSELRPMGMEYFQLGIPCPFLEEEACSIHGDRPLACREYLVTSDPAHCAQPTAQTIEMVPISTRISTIITRIGVEPGQRFARWQPLVLATETRLTEGSRRDHVSLPGPEMLKLVFERMAEKTIAPQAAPTAEGSDSPHTNCA